MLRFSKVSGFDSFGKQVKTFVFSPIYMNLKINNVKVGSSNMIFVNILKFQNPRWWPIIKVKIFVIPFA